MKIKIYSSPYFFKKEETTQESKDDETTDEQQKVSPEKKALPKPVATPEKQALPKPLSPKKPESNEADSDVLEVEVIDIEIE